MQINSREDLVKVLRECLRIEVSHDSSYTGGMGGDSGSLYEKTTTLQILLDDEIICEAVISP